MSTEKCSESAAKQVFVQLVANLLTDKRLESGALLAADLQSLSGLSDTIDQAIASRLAAPIATTKSVGAATQPPASAPPRGQQAKLFAELPQISTPDKFSDYVLEHLGDFRRAKQDYPNSVVFSTLKANLDLFQSRFALSIVGIISGSVLSTNAIVLAVLLFAVAIPALTAAWPIVVGAIAVSGALGLGLLIAGAVKCDIYRRVYALGQDLGSSHSTSDTYLSGRTTSPPSSTPTAIGGMPANPGCSPTRAVVTTSPTKTNSGTAEHRRHNSPSDKP